MTTATPWGEPARLGPTWQKGDDGKFAVPDLTLGWHVAAWAKRNLQHANRRAWRYTNEQFRFVLWWYALTDLERFLYRDGALQRLKGWGKDPLAATLCAVEFVGPSRPSGQLARAGNEWGIPAGQPLGVVHTEPWVQCAAVSITQTRNTMRLFPGLFTKQAITEHKIDLGKEVIYAQHGRCTLEAVTSSPATLEGARSTFVLRNETQNWLSSNAGHDMDRVIDGNVTKAPDGNARALSICNAYRPHEDSVGQRAREAYEAGQAGTSRVSGILYDSLEASPDAPLTAEAAPAVVQQIRGDSVWLVPERVVQSILDPRNPPSESRRKWFNQVVASEDAWIDPKDFDLCSTDVDPTVEPLADGDEITLFFDGSKSDDATALVACRIRDGLVAPLGMWQRPPGKRGDLWLAPRDKVDDAVADAWARYRPVLFWGDPSHTRDDETQERYWDELFDTWHRRYAARLKKELWAVVGRNGHAVMWDMSSSDRTAQFTAAAERCASDIEERTLRHNGDQRLVIHTRNARRAPNRDGVSLRKEHRESARKIDLAVCMVGARMLRRLWLNHAGGKTQRTGKVW